MATKQSISGKTIQASDSIVPLAIGSQLHEYEIVGVVGEGGFGVVYHGVDKRLEREVAIKEFMPSMWASRLEDGSVVCRSDKHKLIFETSLAGFINEARLLARFKHRALVQVLHFWEQSGTAYMVMPLYKGQTLKQMVKQNAEPITQARLIGIIEALMGALEVLHLENCYHRDLSPDNVILLEDGSPILLDFGAARRSTDDVDQTFTVILKPGYAPVEQYANDSSIQQGPWTDIYGLAALCYFVITNRTPITSVTRLMRDQLIPLAEQNIDGFDSKFLKLIDWGMAVKPEDRPQSISEYRDQFNNKATPTASVVIQVEKPEVEKEIEKEVNINKSEAEKPEVKKLEALTSKYFKKQEQSLFATAFVELKSSSQVVLPITELSVNAPRDLVINSVPDENIVKTDNAINPRPKANYESKLESKSPENSLKNLKTYAVAATLLLAVTLGLTAWFSVKKSDNPSVASNPTPSKSTESDKPSNSTIVEPAKKPQVAKLQDSLGPKEVIVAPVSSSNTVFPSTPMAMTTDLGMVGPVKPLMLQGFVQINVIPWGKVFVNDVFVGVTPPLRRLPLNIGVHKITIRSEGFTDAIQSVTVKQDQSVKVTHDFN